MRYVEVTLADIQAANKISDEVFGRSLDELPPQTRRLLLLIDTMVKDACQSLKMARSDFRFTRKDVRRHTRWSDFQVRIHLERLLTLEYLLVHRGGRGQTIVYELLYDGKGQDGKPFILGLLDLGELGKEERERLYRKPMEAQTFGYDKKFEGQNGQFEGSLSPHCAPIEVGVCVG